MMVRTRRAWRVAAVKAGDKQPGKGGSHPPLRNYRLTHAGIAALVDNGRYGYTEDEMAAVADRAASAALPSGFVRWLLGWLPESWAEALPLTPKARYVTVAPEEGGTGTCIITWAFNDPLAELVPVTAIVRADRAMWCIGVTENGTPAMIWKHLPVLVVGMSGAGKSNLLWTIIMSQLLSGEPFEIWCIDPKGGVEFRELGQVAGGPLVREYARDRKGIRDLIVKLFNRLEIREKAMAATGERYHVPTDAEPRILVPIDELVTVYGHISAKPSLEQTFAEFLSRCRAAGISPVCATTTPFGHSIGEKVRDKFPTKVVGRINDTFVTSAMFGPHAEQLGIRATQIKTSTPGVFYTHMNEWAYPSRLRTPYQTDDMVRLLAQGRLPDGLVLREQDLHPEVAAPMGLRENRTHYFYEFYTETPEGVQLPAAFGGGRYAGVLYVGISVDAVRRQDEHLSNEQKRVLNTVGVGWHITRQWTALDCADDIIAGRTVKQVAEDYEKHMIQRLRPPLNIAHNGNGKRGRKALGRGPNRNGERS
jgi:hypothetical protein